MARYKIDGQQPRKTVDIKYIANAAAKQVLKVYLVASATVHLIWELASNGWVRIEKTKFVSVRGKFIRLKDQK